MTLKLVGNEVGVISRSTPKDPNSHTDGLENGQAPLAHDGLVRNNESSSPVIFIRLSMGVAVIFIRSSMGVAVRWLCLS